mmetsp:Transcript_22232/g.25537  ORF Transcript_22232/g.25537 Transcript_22232/m.25537 type:complete len:93 (+) Transcript_22232:125-403(+)
MDVENNLKPKDDQNASDSDSSRNSKSPNPRFGEERRQKFKVAKNEDKKESISDLISQGEIHDSSNIRVTESGIKRLKKFDRIRVRGKNPYEV